MKQQKPPPGYAFIADYTDEDGNVITLGIASRLGISTSTYRKWRMAGKGPQTFPLGKRIAARIDAIDAWLAGLEQTAQQHVEHAMRPAEPRHSRRNIRAAA